MKVLTVTHFYGAHGGGIERVAERIVAGLESRGVEIEWAATDLPGESPSSSASFRALPMRGWNGLEKTTGLPFPIWWSSSLERLREAARRADLVHVHDGIYIGTQAAARFARQFRRPVVLTQHIGEIPFPDAPRRLAQRLLHRLFLRQQIRKSDVAVFVSAAVEEFFRGLRPGGATEIVYNGVDSGVFFRGTDPKMIVRRRLRLDPEATVFLFVGRFVAKKGLDRLREAARALPRVQWLLAGRGPLDPARWKLANVRLLGQVSQGELADWYRAADLTVLPSFGEGLPLIVQESMACGTPCLVSEEIRRACPPLSSWLLSAGPLGRDFVSACHDAIRSPERLRRLGDGVAEIASKTWSWERCVERYLQIYRKLIGQDVGAGASARAHP